MRPALYKGSLISVFEQKLRVQQIYAGLVVVGASLFVGYLLGLGMFGWMLLGFGTAATTWLVTLPYHSQISIYLAVATFSSAIIVPMFPGRPFLWEFAAFLGWSGLVLTISLRQHDPNSIQIIRKHRWLFVGLVGYCMVLIVIMFYRGVGLRILGTAQMGGRFYMQQLICAIFPLLFVMFRTDEKILPRLFLAQCLMSGTYVISDLAFAGIGLGGKLSVLLYFFELPGDAVNFEMKAMNFGVRRFQSMGFFGQGLSCAVLLYFGLKEFTGRRMVFLIPIAGAIVAMGLFSGHRIFILMMSITLVFCAFAQRFFTIRNTAAVGVAAGLTIMAAYAFAYEMPLSIQRALSVLPGIDIDNQARLDGAGTLETRRLLRRAGMDMIPDYLWIGRGFGISSQVDYSSLWDSSQATSQINQGQFYNGLIGLMVNTGIFGTFFMLLFLGSGSVIAWRIILYLRRHGCEDTFSRMCCIIASFWMTNLISFIFVHGDSEYAMKTFSLQAGLLLACHRLLLERQKTSRVPA